MSLDDKLTLEQAQLMVRNSHSECMTGQDWYNRFEKELGKWTSLSIESLTEPLIVQSRDSVMEAAQRAAGITND